MMFNFTANHWGNGKLTSGKKYKILTVNSRKKYAPYMIGDKIGSHVRMYEW